MTGHRRFSKRDGNHAELVRAARALGFSVLEVHTVGGALDLVLGYQGIDQRVEVKDPSQYPSDRRLTKAEQETFEVWRGRRPVVIETTEQLELLRVTLLKERSAYLMGVRP